MDVLCTRAILRALFPPICIPRSTPASHSSDSIFAVRREAVGLRPKLDDFQIVIWGDLGKLAAGFLLEGREGLSAAVARIAFSQNQKSADTAAVQKHEAESLRSLRLPAFFSESLQSCRHGLCQVDGGFEARAFDDFPLQVKENDEPRRLGAGVDVVVVAHDFFGGRAVGLPCHRPTSMAQRDSGPRRSGSCLAAAS